MRLSTKPSLIGLTGALLLLAASPASAQSEGLIQAEVDTAVEQSLWKWGPFRLTPELHVGAGYDSNSLSSPAVQVDDFAATIAPGIRVVTPMGNRAVLELYEEVDFVYYHRVEDLRDIFNVTRFGGAVGGRKLLFRVQDEFRGGKTRPTSEFDIPAERRSNVLTAFLDIAVGKKQQLTISYRNTRLRYEDLVANPFSRTELLNRTEETYGLRLSRRLTAKTTAVVEGLFQNLNFTEKEARRDGQALMGWAGFTFNPKTNLRGQALLGYRYMVPEFPEQPEYEGVIASVDVQIRLGERMDVTALYSRNTLPSVVRDNWFFIENRFGGAVDIYVTRSFFVRPGATFGRNTYPRPTTIINDQGDLVEERIEDNFDIYSLSFNYGIGGFWRAYVGGNYLNRESNFRLFTKDRFYLSFGIATDFTAP